jgi:hypothetical protein
VLCVSGRERRDCQCGNHEHGAENMSHRARCE